MMRARMTCMVRVVVGAFAIALAMLATTDAATYYVSKEGNTGNSCATAQSPGSKAKLTIAAGAACMSGGDTLLIQAGTYTESMIGSGEGSFPWRSGTSGNYTRYARYQNDRVVIRPSGGDRVLYMDGPSYIELDGLIIDGMNVLYNVVKLDSYQGTTHHIRIKNSELTMAGAAPVPWPGQPMIILEGGDRNEYLNNNIHHSPNGYGMYITRTNALIDGNIIHDNGGFGIHVYEGSGKNLTANVTIRNNKIYNNGFTERYCGMILSTGNGNIAYNNVIYGNYACGIQIDYSMTNPKAIHNTIYGNGQECIYVGSGSRNAEIRNNICYQNRTDIVNNGSGTVQSNNLTSNPMFVDAPNANFHLQVGSPAVDQGLTLSIVTNDYDGILRPQDGASDIGAYEYSKNGSIKRPAPANFRIVSK
jgi:parallel beta-helix repeat protein